MLTKMLKAPGSMKMPVIIKTREQAIFAAKNFTSERCVAFLSFHFIPCGTERAVWRASGCGGAVLYHVVRCNNLCSFHSVLVRANSTPPASSRSSS